MDAGEDAGERETEAEEDEDEEGERTRNGSWADCVTVSVNYYNLPARTGRILFRNQSPADVIVILIISGTRGKLFERRRVSGRAGRESRFTLEIRTRKTKQKKKNNGDWRNYRAVSREASSCRS